MTNYDYDVDVPDVPILDLRITTRRTVLVRCPWCDKHHRHVWKIGTATPGVMRSHCKRDRRPYKIVVTR